MVAAVAERVDADRRVQAQCTPHRDPGWSSARSSSPPSRLLAGRRRLWAVVWQAGLACRARTSRLLSGWRLDGCASPGVG